MTGKQKKKKEKAATTGGITIVEQCMEKCLFHTTYPPPVPTPSPRPKCAAASGPCKQINSAANCKQSKSQMLRWELK